MASNDLTSKPNTENLFTLLKHSKQDSASVAPLRKHNSVHQDYPTKATILNEQFQSVLVGSLLTASAIPLSHETTRKDWCRQIRDMRDITVTSKGIEKLLFNLNPHKAADPDQIKPIILTNLSTPLSPILKHKSSSTRKPFHQSGRMLMWRLSATKCERSNPANYMPISLTCILCKTLEHIVASSIKTPISAKDLL